MRQKKVKALRKKLGLKLPIKPDYKVVNRVKKTVYFKDKLGNRIATPSERVVIINVAKHQYRSIKKMMKKGK